MHKLKHELSSNQQHFPLGLLVMFIGECGTPLISQTTSLQGKNLDYFGDSRVAAYVIYRLLGFDGELNVPSNKLSLP